MTHTQVESIPRVARLQFEAVEVYAENWQVDYELILPLGEVDCRGTYDHEGRKTRPKSHRHVWLDKDNNRHIPMGRTKVGTSNPNYPFNGNKIDLPFRDGAHCSWDNEKLNLPIYYTVGGNSYLLTEGNL
jgi:hypothetical protein